MNNNTMHTLSPNTVRQSSGRAGRSLRFSGTVSAGRGLRGRRSFRMLGVGLILLLLLTAAGGCGGSAGTAAGGKDTVVIYDGQFSEMWLVHRMVKLLVEEHTDAKVEIREEMAPAPCYDTIVRGESDLMNSYDGTLCTTYLHMDPTDAPEGTSLYDFVNQEGMETTGVRLLDKLGINNTYVLAVTQAVYDQYGMETASDLAQVSGELVFGAEHDFFTEEGSAKFNPMAAFYGLEFMETRQMDLALKYSAVESGNLDVTLVYTTDGLNRKYNLKTLEDDRQFFPEYNGAILVRDAMFAEMQEVAPNLEEVINMLGGQFTNDIMTDLTYAVDVEGQDPTEVAAGFLREKGLIS